jgi:Domain of unknown function (DUF4279)
VNAYRYAISLRIRHPSLDPREITKTVKIKPRVSWQAGEARSAPSGQLLGGTRRESYWTSGDLARGKWPRKDLAQAIAALLDRLEAHKRFFARVHAQGGRSELFIGWYFLGNSGDVLPCELMARLAQSKIDLSFDIYPPDQPQNDI